MSVVDKKKLKKIVIAVAVLLILPSLIYGVLFWVRHGTIRISTELNIERVMLYKKPELTPHEFSGRTIHVRPGEYIVKVYFEGNRSYSKEVEVERFLRRTYIEAFARSLQFERVLELGTTNFLPLAEDRYLFLNTRLNISSVFVPSTAAIRGFQPRELTDMFYTKQDVLLMANIGDGEISYYYYNSELGSGVLIDRQPIVGRYVSHLPNYANGFYVVMGHTLYAIGRDGIVSRPMAESISYSLVGSMPIMSKNTSHAAFLRGNDYAFGTAAGEEPPTDEALEETSINIYSLDFIGKGERYKSFQLEKSRDISGIKLSPSSTRIAVIHDERLVIYETTTGTHVMTIMAIANVNRTFWLDDDSIVFMDNSFQLYQANIPEREAFSILAPNTLRVSNLVGMRGNWLYFTAFDSTRDGSQRIPTGYRVRVGNERF